jgi:hypothetical protein
VAERAWLAQDESASKMATTQKELMAMATKRPLMTFAAVLLSACSSSSPAEAPTKDAGQSTSDDADLIVLPRPDAHTMKGTPDTGTVGSAAPDTGVDAGSKCPYPAGPYGVDVTNVLDPTIQWDAYLPGATAPTTLKMTDLYDCDGSKGINAIVFDSSAQWCVACQYEAGNIPAWLSGTGPGHGNWSALGVRFVTLVVQTNSYEPATITTAEQWRNLFNLSAITVTADPGDTFPTPSLPHNILVNPRTMRVTDILDDDNYDAAVAGSDTAEGPDPAVAKLATQNQTTTK